jgi:hypothetical protein
MSDIETPEAQRVGRLTKVEPWRWVVAVVMLGLAVMEMVAHQGAAITTGVVGLVLPDVSFLVGIGRPHERGQLPRITVPFYNTLHRVWLPLAGLVFLAFDWQTNEQAGPYITLFLGWLAHVFIDRAFGFGLRTKDGWQRGAA